MNTSRRDPLECSTLVDLLRWRAQQQPDRRAYTFLLDGETAEAHLTYGDLDRRSRAIGARLRSLVAPGERALLLYPPGLDYIAAFFGCLYAGVVAVPVYPPNPARLDRTLPRLQAIAANARPSVVLTTEAIMALAGPLAAQASEFQGLRWLATDASGDDAAEQWQSPPLAGADLAMLQYTSGSTAAPKGVMLSHANLLHNSALIQRCFEHTANSQGVIWLPPYHDMGLIGGIIQPLYAGFPVTLLSPIDFLQRPLRWLVAVSRYRATTSGGPNFAYDLCARKATTEQIAALDLSSWTVAFNGAEPIRPETLERFATTFAPCGFRREAFYPCYGLAEATLIVSGGSRAAPPVVRGFDAGALGEDRVVEAAAPDAARMLVGCGQQLPEQQIVVVDAARSTPCPAGRVGEVWVRGASVAQGYWEQPQETEGAFLAFTADREQGPFLRTGDLGFVEEGELFITGRLKDLIIIRGRNHYPQDIELAAERSHPVLRPGCGAAFGLAVGDEERLVVVQEVERQARDVKVDEIVAAIRRAVAEQHEIHVYAVALIRAGSIPKTSSGKIQRHACRVAFVGGALEVLGQSIVEDEAAPERGVELDRAALMALAPEERGPALETYLRAQVARVLRIDPANLDPRQPISTLGLDSLMAVDLQHAVETHLGVALPMVSFLEGQNVAQIAADIVGRLTLEPVALTPAPVEAEGAVVEYPVSFGQRALWFLHRLAPESAAYNIATGVRIRGELDEPGLRQAFQALVDRHPALRTSFADSGGEPVQRVHASVAIDFLEADASGWGARSLDDYLVAEAHRPFQLEHPSLLRVLLIRRSVHEHLLLLVVHHSVADLWSLVVLFHELGLIYAAQRAGSAPALAPLSLRYTDYVRWQADMIAGPRGEQLAAYWREQLAGAPPVLDLPTDRPRPPVQTYRGAAHAIELGGALTTRLKALAQAAGTTTYTLLLASFYVLLHRYSGQDDLLVGSPTTGRSRADLAGLVGYFVNPVVLRADLSSNPTFTAFLAQVRSTVLAALAHQEYPFALLVERLQPERDPSRSPLFQAMFVLQKAHLHDDEGLAAFTLGDSSAHLRLGALGVDPFALEQQIAQFDLTLAMVEAGEGLIGSLQYNTDLFDATTIARLGGHLLTLLSGIAADPDRRLADLPLLTASERQCLLTTWNTTAAEYPHQVCLHQLFEAQAARIPDGVALVFDRPPTTDHRPPTGDTETGRQGDGETRSDGGWPQLSPQSSALSPEHLTYRELNRRANQLAHHLRGLGVGPEVRVGLCMERVPELVIAILGILKAGGAYVPLDPVYPRERLSLMLEDAAVPVVLTHTPALEALPSRAAAVVCLDSAWEALAATCDDNPPGGTTPEQGAYVLFTSGSTGRPKGVYCDHRGVVNLLADFARRAPLAAGDRCSVWTNTSFDVSVYEIFSALTAGGTLHLASDPVRADGPSFVRWLSAQRIQSAYIPPFMVADLAAAAERGAAPPLRRVLVGVEPIGESMLAAITAGIPGLRIINGYGPTEATICATLYTVQPHIATNRTTPIGRPVQNTEIYLLDRRMQPVPVGVAGELYIGGVGLARGYLHRPDLTAERFVPNPFADEPGTRDLGRGARDQERPPKPLAPSPKSHGARLYRTGDLARYRADGNIEFLGRIDNQVKIRGYRIELGEIETLLAQHPGVAETVVLVREDVPGNKRLVAYVVPATDKETRRQGDKESGRHGDKETRRQGDKVTGDASDPQSLALSPQDSAPPSSFILHPSSLDVELRSFLQTKLPDYMMPSAFVLLDALPRTPNGKIDRNALPAPTESAAEAAFLAPRTPGEMLLAQLWAEVLGVTRVGLHDSFFALGGHSLLATRLVARIRDTFGVELPLRALFTNPTLGALATQLEAARASAITLIAPPIRPVEHAGRLPLSFAQQRLWLLDQFEPGNPAYNIPVAARLHGPLDVAAWRRSLQGIVARHETLRTTFTVEAGQPVQMIGAAWPLALPLYDLRGLPAAERDAQAARLIAVEARQPFDLARGPLVRAALLRLAADEHVVLLTMHHIVSDGWSMQVFLGELARLYVVGGARAALPALPIQYGDYAVWQTTWLQGAVLETQLAYWQRQLAGAPPVLDLPTDRPRPVVQTYNGATLSFALPPALSRAVGELSRREEATLFMVLLAAFQVLLHRYTGQEDIVVGTPVAGRTHTELEPLIGFFVNTLVLRTDLAGAPTFPALLRRVKEVCLDAYAHQDLPFEKLVEELQPERDLGHTPLFQVTFALQDTLPQMLALPGLSVEPIESQTDTAKFDITLFMGDTEGGLTGLLEYNTDLFDATTMARLVGHFQTLLESIVAVPDCRIGELPILTPAELQQLLFDWNASAADYPRDSSVQLLVEAQAARIPDTVAAVFDQPTTGDKETRRQGDEETRRQAGQPQLSPQSSVLSPEHLTYGELNRRANQLAHHLRDLGVGPDVLVGICVERSLEMLVGILGIIKAGAAYVPLDPTYPRERLQFMLDDTQAPVLLTQRHLLARLPGIADEPGTRDLGLGAREKEPASRPQAPSPTRTVVCLDADWGIIGQRSAENPPSRVLGEHRVYIIYTSGSTGRPKGVMVKQRGLINLCFGLRAFFDDAAVSDTGLITSISFDISVNQIFPTLIFGRTLHIIPDAVKYHSRALADYLTQRQIHLLDSVPSYLNNVLTEIQPERVPNALRYILIGGEKLEKRLLQKIFDQLGPRVVIVNIYGLTEITDINSLSTITSEDLDKTITIGWPLNNNRIYLTNPYGSLQPVGVTGELCIGGESLSRGYLNRPELTAEKFIPNPFADHPGTRDEGRDPKPQVSGTRDLGLGTWEGELAAKPLAPSPLPHGEWLCRTGDVGRRLADGAIELFGRIDHQVKVRGFRIEVGEIEALLERHPAVRENVVVAREDGSGDRRLVAYIVQGPGARGQGSGVADQEPSVDPRSPIPDPRSLIPELRAFLKELLPDYMIPAVFVFLEALPHTPNGKIDRKALPAPPSRLDELDGAFVAPRTPGEELMAGIWARVLHCPRVGLHDSFFALGGHSLLATQLISRVRETFGVELPLRALFEAPTVAALTAEVEAVRSGALAGTAPPLVPLAHAGARPLSFAQQRLWLLDQFEPGNPAYNIPIAARLRGPLDVAAWRGSLHAIVGRHETLRTIFTTERGRPVQVVAPALRLPVPLIDLRMLPAPARADALERLIAADARQPFDLARGPLVRAALLRLADDEHVALLTMHHIVSDGWSMTVLIRELAAHYTAALWETRADLPALPIQYGDYAAWQADWLQGAVLETQLAYWRQQLAGAPPVLDLPTDHPRAAVRTFRSAQQTMALPEQLSAAIGDLSRWMEVTPFMTLLAAFAILLHRYTGQEDIVVGTPVAGRTHAEIEDLIGFFLNTLVLRVDLSGAPGFPALLRRVREVCLGAYAHQDLPFEKLLDELQPERDLSHTPLFQVFFNMLNLPDSRVKLPDLSLELLASPDIGSKFDLTLYVEEKDRRFQFNLVYNADLFEADRIRELLEQLQHLLSQVVAQREEPIERFSLVTATARAALPDPTAALDDTWEGAVHTALSCQARRVPGRLAVIDPHEAWTYAELEARSNQLANYLVGHGIERQDVVAIYAHRSAGLVWALMGIFKAGAAFTILDPAYPPARLISYLRIARPRGWVRMAAAGPLPDALEAFVESMPCCCRLTLPLDASAGALDLLAGEPADDPGVAVGPDDLACIGFTSGSTGMPKGILGRHGPLTHFLPWQSQAFGLDESDRFSLLSGIAHDPLQRDIFTPLWLGATICIPNPEDIHTPGRLAEWMREANITVAHLTPALGQLLTETEPGAAISIPSLRYAFIVGDVLTRTDVARIRRLAPRVNCVNFYGSTETQRAVGYYIIPDREAQGGDQEQSAARFKEILPLGSGMKDVQLLVLNGSQQMAGIGEVGEIYVRSPHLARGYIDDDALTAERFIPNPFADHRPPTTDHRPADTETRRHGDKEIGEPEGYPNLQSPISNRQSPDEAATQNSKLETQNSDRLYRTGDLGRYMPDGTVEFCGRADHQVKIRGFRIELGEIEAVLGRHATVREAVVVAREDTPGARRLVAYVVPQPDHPPLIGELRQFLHAQLPNYMVPAAFVLLDALPLTPNGKVDRRALPKPAAPQRDGEMSYVAPQTEVERAIAAVWQAVLQVESVSVNDNFFELGGSSIHIVQAHSRLREVLKKDVPILEMFKYPTIATLAGYISQERDEEPAVDEIQDRINKQKAVMERRKRLRFKA